MLLNPCKFNVVFRTTDLHFHSMLSFKRPQGTKTFSVFYEPPHGMGGECGYHSSYQLESTRGITQGTHHFLYLFAAQELVLLKTLSYYKKSSKCIKCIFGYSLVYVDSCFHLEFIKKSVIKNILTGN